MLVTSRKAPPAYQEMELKVLRLGEGADKAQDSQLGCFA